MMQILSMDSCHKVRQGCSMLTLKTWQQAYCMHIFSKHPAPSMFGRVSCASPNDALLANIATTTPSTTSEDTAASANVTLERDQPHIAENSMERECHSMIRKHTLQASNSVVQGGPEHTPDVHMQTTHRNLNYHVLISSHAPLQICPHTLHPHHAHLPVRCVWWSGVW